MSQHTGVVPNTVVRCGEMGVWPCRRHPSVGCQWRRPRGLGTTPAWRQWAWSRLMRRSRWPSPRWGKALICGTACSLPLPASRRPAGWPPSPTSSSASASWPPASPTPGTTPHSITSCGARSVLCICRPSVRRWWGLGLYWNHHVYLSVFPSVLSVCPGFVQKMSSKALCLL